MPGPIDDRVTGKNYKSGWGGNDKDGSRSSIGA